MRASKHVTTIAAAAVGVGLVVSTGCALHASGGGAILSANRVDKATFAFSFNGPKGKLSGTYFDRGTGERLKFDGLDAYVDDPGNNDQCMTAYGRYESRTKDKPGEGTVRLIACDGGGPSYDEDMVEIAVLTGPLAGYLNAGELLHGNVKTHNRPQPVPAD